MTARIIKSLLCGIGRTIAIHLINNNTESFRNCQFFLMSWSMWNSQYIDNCVPQRLKFWEEIGSGSFGKVYLAVNEKREKVALKLESNEVSSTRLMKENQIYCLLCGGIGIPRVHFFGHEQDYTILAMDALGPSLDDLFQRCSRRFSLKTVLMLVEQLLNRLEYLHSKYFLHRDVKPANFVMGTGHYDHIVYMIDYGLSERFCDYTMKHTPNRSRFGIGTPLFSSTNIHFRMTPSRRDDLESLAYMLIFFLKGTLPWEGLKGRKASHTWEKIAEKKISMTVEDLCEGCPEEFGIFLHYCRKLEYEEKPDYEDIRILFRMLAKKLNYEYDCEYDWVINKLEMERPQPETPAPVPAVTPKEKCPLSGPLKDLNLGNVN